MKAIHLTAYGDPALVLSAVDIPEPPAPGVGEILIGLEYAPLNHSDLLLAAGRYFLRPQLPAVIGGEGAGIILAVGSDVTALSVGDRVTIPFTTFAWAERVVAAAKDVFLVPPEISAQQASMLNINPTTAVLLLTEFVNLNPGDWVALNAANSAVGRSLIAVANALGLKTVCVVRRQELVAELIALGANCVVLDSPDLVRQVNAATDRQPIRLGLDAVGGAATDTLARILAVNGQIVVYAGLGSDAIQLSHEYLLGKRIGVHGFSMYYDDFLPKLKSATTFAVDLVRSGKLDLAGSAIYTVSRIKEAVEHVQLGGKALLDFRA
jgi:NADPH:quinone reductase-like Zn-dependent oxidoreductase